MHEEEVGEAGGVLKVLKGFLVGRDRGCGRGREFG